jgi:PKD repeat protein
VRDASRDWQSFVQFTVVGLTGAPNTATLRLWVTDASPDGGTVSTTDNGWSESGITWATAPAIGSTIGEVGSAASGTWVEVDVTTAISGNGTVSFVIASGNGNSVVYSSREGDQAPQLVLVTGSVPPPPPPAPVADFTASPTSGTTPLTEPKTTRRNSRPTALAGEGE